MQRYRIMISAALAVLGVASAACDPAGGSGALKVTTYGEAFIEEQIPAAGGGVEGIVDGYTVSYSKFLVCLAGLKVAHRDGAVGGAAPAPQIFDLHPAGPHEVASFDELEARRWDRVEVTVQPASGAAAGNASSADVKLMNDGGYSVYVEGLGKKGTQQIRFAWGFSTRTRYYDCSEQSVGEGVVVPAGGTANVELTIHGDHLLYDDLQSSTPSLRFAAIAAADANQDGQVTLEELGQVDLTTLPAGQYGTGGAGSITDLRGFISALTRTVVHYQGEGHCHSGG